MFSNFFPKIVPFMR